MRILKNIEFLRRRPRKGSIATETAILLPLFIVGILTIGSLLKFCMISEGAHHALTDEAHRIMAEAAVVPFPVGAAGEIEKRIEQGSRMEASDAQVKLLYPFFGISRSGATYGNLISISAVFDAPLKLPRLFRGGNAGERLALCRAFVGLSRSSAVKSFDDMERGDGEGMVWIFPRSGERYHKEDCAYIKNNPREILLDKSTRSKYTPCKLCDPHSARDGTLVYCFETSGRAYHTGSCTLVERYVIEIDKEDAERQGYTACSKCGG